MLFQVKDAHVDDSLVPKAKAVYKGVTKTNVSERIAALERSPLQNGYRCVVEHCQLELSKTTDVEMLAGVIKKVVKQTINDVEIAQMLDCLLYTSDAADE